MSDVLDELERYFGGQLVGEMGMRSSLGAVLEYGTGLGGPNGRTPPDPSLGALAAARTVTRVEEVLAEITSEQRTILMAAYRPHGPNALPWARELGAERFVAVLVNPNLRALVERRRSRDKAERTAAGREMRVCASKARAAVQEARDAYLEAAAMVRRRRRQRRAERLRVASFEVGGN